MNCYIDNNGNPFRCNYECNQFIKKTPEEYAALVTFINNKVKKDQEAEELLLKPSREYEIKIQARLREMAIKELEKEQK